MKTRIVFSLVSAVLVVFVGNSFGTEDVVEPMEATKVPAEIETPLKYKETLEPQGIEGATNTFYGLGAGSSTTGIENSFFGRSAGYNNTEGHNNSFFGYGSGYHNTTEGFLSGHSNSFFGYYSGHDNTTGISNSFFGTNAGNKNTIGDSNSFFGMSAGYSNTTGEFNTFIGRSAGHDNTVGFNNSFFGYDAGYSNTFGDYNSFFGSFAGYNNTTGDFNTFFGMYAGYENTTGVGNSFFGVNAGLSNVSGSGNVFLGTNAGNCDPTDKSNQLFIDNSNTPTPLVWGDFANKDIVIYGGFKAIASYSSSDKRWKKNIKLLESSLDKIADLKGVSYEWKTDEYPDVGMTEGKQIGLIAQEVEEVLPELVSEDKDGYKAVSYTKLTAVLVEAVKELKIQNQAQKETLKKQQAEIQELRLMIEALNS